LFFSCLGNLRSLLSTLKQVLPEDANWKDISLADLLDDKKVTN